MNGVPGPFTPGVVCMTVDAMPSSTVRLLPPRLAGGINCLMTPYSSSVRSLG